MYICTYTRVHTHTNIHIHIDIDIDIYICITKYIIIFIIAMNEITFCSIYNSNIL